MPFIGATFQTRNPRLSIGFAVYVPFGATLEFPATGAQRFAVTEIAMRTIYAGPAIAYRVTPRLSVGAAITYIYADLRLRQANALQFVTGDRGRIPTRIRALKDRRASPPATTPASAPPSASSGEGTTIHSRSESA